MSSSTLTEEFVSDYFRYLNPIATQIFSEIDKTIDDYEHYWNELDQREQAVIINEAVIKPEIQLNYHRSHTKEEAAHDHPYRDIDASLLNYFRPKSDIEPRPFSYKTRSQQNLFYSLAQGATKESGASAVRLPTAKSKNHQMNKSTDSLPCVTFVNLNVKAKKGRAPAVPSKMTTKPPPPPPTTATKVIKVIEPPPPTVIAVSKSTVEAKPTLPAPPLPPMDVPVVIEDIPRIPEDNNSNTSLLSPADDLEEEQPVTHLHQVNIAEGITATEPSDSNDNDDEFKSLLDSNQLMDFLNNW